MKKQIAMLLVLSGTIVYTNAQITITNASFPGPGDIAIAWKDTTPSIVSAGPAGANQVWDFSMLNNHSTDTNIYLNPSSTPNGPSFPFANLAVRLNGNDYAYLYKGSTEVDLTGFFGDPGIGANLTIHFSSSGIIRKAGITYNSSYTYINSFLEIVSGASINQPLADSVRIHYDKYSSDSIDGWGTIINPVGSFPCIRLKITDSIVTVVDVKLPIVGWQNNFQSSVEVNHSYQWMDDVNAKSIVTLNMNSTGDTVKSASYRLSYSVGIKETVKPSVFIAYPNPAGRDLHLLIGGLIPGDYLLRISALDGKEIFTRSYRFNETGISPIEIRISNFCLGNYLVTVFTPSYVPLETVKIQIAR